jgi:hypothetical protein
MLNDYAPLLQGFLVEEVLGEVLDGFELLGRVLSAACKHISHSPGVLSDALRHSVNGAKFWRNVTRLAVNLNNKERLLGISDHHVIAVEEVLSDAKFLAVMSLKPHGDGCLLEVDVFNEVSFLMAVGADDNLVLELVKDTSRLVLDVGGVVDLVDALEAGLVRDELVDVVDHNCQARSVVEGGGSESRAGLEAGTLNVDSL